MNVPVGTTAGAGVVSQGEVIEVGSLLRFGVSECGTPAQCVLPSNPAHSTLQPPLSDTIVVLHVCVVLLL